MIALYRLAFRVYERCLAPLVNWLFFHHLVVHTENFFSMRWLGTEIRQNTFDLWTIQETIAELRPEFLIECGTKFGGSALFYANLFDLLGRGHVITINIDKRHSLNHPRVTPLEGDSAAPEIVEQVEQLVAGGTGPILVILDSDHSADHVERELNAYARLVTPGSYCLVQDGAIDKMWIFRNGRPGPVVAVNRFLKNHPEFEIDRDKERRFLITHHPSGWLRRVR